MKPTTTGFAMPRIRLALIIAIAAGLALPAAASAAIPVEFIDQSAPGDDPAFFKAGGLKLKGTCEAGPDLDVAFKAKPAGSTIHINSLATGPVNNAPGEYAGFQPAPAGATVFTGEAADGLQVADDQAVGQLVYAEPGGTVVAMDWLADEGGALGADCAFVGTAKALDSGPKRLFFRQNAGGEEKQLLDLGGLTVTARCDGAGSLDFGVDGGTDSVVHLTNHSDFNADTIDDDIYQGVDHMVGDGAELSTFMNNAVGQIIYTNGKRIVTIDYFADEDGGSLGTECAVAGIAATAKAGAPSAALFAETGDIEERTFFKRSSMRLRASCDIFQDIDVDVRSKGFASVHADSQSNFDGMGGTEENFVADAEIEPGGDELELFGTALQDNSTAGQIVYAGGVDDLSYVSVDYLADEDDALGEDCLFAGIATTAG